MDRIGILAGGGRLPIMIADSVVARGGSVHIVGIEGEADQDLTRFPHTLVNWGQIGRMVATLRAESGPGLVIAGSVRRPDLWKLRPDPGLVRSLPQIAGLLAGGDDSVLSRVVRFFEGKGFTVLGAHQVAPALVAQAGRMGAVALSGPDRADAALGFAVRAALGPLDAGQAVAVAEGRVLAIEGAEGTDAMLRRVAAQRHGMRRQGRAGVLTKGPKPGQELRVDMPVVGSTTVELAADAGLAGIAVEAGAVLVLGRDEAVAAADARGLAVEGLPQSGAREDGGARARRHDARVLGRAAPGARDRADVAKGLAALARLSAYGTGPAVVVARAYILAIAAGESAHAMLGRVRALRQWGMRGQRRVGVLVCDAAHLQADAFAQLCAEAAAQGLAGIALTGTPDQLSPYEDASGAADGLGLFLVTCRSG
jgi:DUF1009 family protein